MRERNIEAEIYRHMEVEIGPQAGQTVTASALPAQSSPGPGPRATGIVAENSLSDIQAARASHCGIQNNLPVKR
jgi:hypothetical protein